MKKEILEKWDNTCIKVLSVEHGRKVIKFWESVGVDTNGHSGCVINDYYGLYDGAFNLFTNKSFWENKRILTLEEAIEIRDKNIKTFPREMYVWDSYIESAKKELVFYICNNEEVFKYDLNYKVIGRKSNHKNAMEIEEYEEMTNKQNENDELIKQIKKTEKELAELKSKLNK